MSPLWRNRLCIAISPERISLLKLGRGLKPKLLAKHDEAISLSGRQSAWQAAVEKLDTILSQPEWQNSEVDIVLSNRLVRYAAIPFDAKLKNDAAQQAFARYSLTQIYGSVAGQWELRIQRGKVGKPWLVSAVDKALLDQLRQVCVAHKLKLRSAIPYLAPIFNHHLKSLKAEPAWLVINEPGYSLIALLRDRELIAVNGVCHDNLREMPLLLDRENLASTLPEPCKSVYLYSPFGNGVSVMPKLGYEFSVLAPVVPDGFSALNEGLYAMAMSGTARGQLQLNYQQAVDMPSRRAGWLLLLASLALVAEMGFSYDNLQRDREAMHLEVRSSKLRMDVPREKAIIQKYSDEDFAQARQIISRLSAPWDEFFVGLESVSNENAAILAIEPDVKTGILRIEGEAKDYASVLTLIAQLRSTKPFSKVFLLRHETKRDDPQHPVSFTLSLHWVKS